MKIKRAYLEYDNTAGWGWVISDEHYSASGFAFHKVMAEFRKYSQLWQSFKNKTQICRNDATQTT